MEIHSRLRLQDLRSNTILDSSLEIYKLLEITSCCHLKSIELSFQLGSLTLKYNNVTIHM